MESISETLKIDHVITEEKKQKMAEILQSLTLSSEGIDKLMAAMEHHMKLASSADKATRDKSDLLMAITHVRCLLDGKENGTYLGLDLGSSNFRVVKVKFTDGEAETDTSVHTLTDDVRSGPCDRIFEFIARTMRDFLDTHGLLESTEKIPVGFTFSFPSQQHSLKKSKLLTWTQTFKNPDGPGRDPVEMLEQAIERETPNLPVDIVAVMSDTTSTLMAGNYLDKKCHIGLIIGTGSNLAFVEHVKNLEKWTGDDKEPQHVIVNAENGSLGDKGDLDFCRTEFDDELDQFSNHPRSFMFEKYFSGHYLGELVRLVLVKLIHNNVLFEGVTSPEILKRSNFTSKDVSMIVRDGAGEMSNTQEVLTRMGLSEQATEEDIAITKHVANLVSKRGAYIVTAALAVCVRHVSLPEVTIAVDGSTYEHHPTFHKHMSELLGKLVPETKVKLILAKDGSSKGAAFVAVSALKQRRLGIVSS